VTLRSLPAALALAMAAAGLAACSTSGSGTVDTPVVSSTAPTTTSSAPEVSSPSLPSSPPTVSTPRVPSSTSQPPATSTPTSTSVPPPVTSSSSTAPPAGPAACTAEQLTISLVRGGAIQHRQIAGLILTNTAAARCTILGYPSAQLVKNGRLIGLQATPTGAAGRGVTLAKGQSAQSELTATTDCQAPLSDHVRVRAPGQSTSVDLADTLRACTLTIGAVERS
jgi:hypothetical protein